MNNTLKSKHNHTLKHIYIYIYIKKLQIGITSLNSMPISFMHLLGEKKSHEK